MCPVCGATIGRPEYDGHDCAAGMVLWKYPATAIKELRQLGVPVPNELGFDAYDDRLFILDHDRELNGNFLGLGDSPAILKALLEILVDGEPVPAVGGEGTVRRRIVLDAERLKSGTAVRE